MKIERMREEVSGSKPYLAYDNTGKIVGIGREFSVFLDGVDVTWKCCGANDGGDGSEPYVDTMKVEGGDPDTKPERCSWPRYIFENNSPVVIRRTGKIEIRKRDEAAA